MGVIKNARKKMAVISKRRTPIKIGRLTFCKEHCNTDKLHSNILNYIANCENKPMSSLSLYGKDAFGNVCTCDIILNKGNFFTCK